MKKVLNIIGKVANVICCLVLFVCVVASIYCMPNAFYVLVTKNVRVKQIERNLNKIPNVEVMKIEDDINLFEHEFIATTIKINDKNLVSFFDINKDIFDKVDVINITSVNGYSFIQCEKDRIKYGIDLGTNTVIGKSLGLTINTIEDVVNNIDVICDMVDNLTHFPEPNYFCTDSNECYIIRIDTNPIYQNPINFLNNYQSKIKNAYEQIN